MAGSARYTALLDANVLYPAFLRDVLLSLAHADLYSAKWTLTIEQEWTAALLRDFPGKEPTVRQIAANMREAVPDCMVTGYEALIEGIVLPDPDDRHVVAGAIAGHADAIVTCNAKHFPKDVLATHGIDVQSPDEFVVNQIMLHKLRSITALKRMRERWQRPEVSAADLIDLFDRRGMPVAAGALKDAVGLL